MYIRVLPYMYNTILLNNYIQHTIPLRRFLIYMIFIRRRTIIYLAFLFVFFNLCYYIYNIYIIDVCTYVNTHIRSPPIQINKKKHFSKHANSRHESNINIRCSNKQIKQNTYKDERCSYCGKKKKKRNKEDQYD